MKYYKPRSNPKVLVVDIETAPILGFVWDLWDQNVGLNQINSDWHLLSFSAKWLDSPAKETMYLDQRHAKNIQDDKQLLRQLWRLFNEADIILGQNSKKFDVKKINARFIQAGFPPPSSFKQIDTVQMARKHFAFTSNKLEYLSDKLCKKYKKLTHAKFSGFTLWTECLKGNMAAWNEMKRYNIHDVLATEELYNVLKAWSDNLPNFNLYHSGEETICRCGSRDFVRNGYFYSATGKYQRYKCNKCNAETRDKKNLLSKTKKELLRTNVSR